MSEAQAKAWRILDRNSTIIREVIAAARTVAADLSGNADDRRCGSYIMIEAVRVERLISAVAALDDISPPNPSRKRL